LKQTKTLVKMDGLDALRYPIGKFKKPTTITESQLEAWIWILHTVLVDGLFDK